MKAIPGQLHLFQVDDYANVNAASNFDMGLSLTIVSTRTKSRIRPHPPISKQTIESLAVKLNSLPPKTKPLTSKD